MRSEARRLKPQRRNAPTSHLIATNHQPLFTFSRTSSLVPRAYFLSCLPEIASGLFALRNDKSASLLTTVYLYSRCAQVPNAWLGHVQASLTAALASHLIATNHQPLFTFFSILHLMKLTFSFVFQLPPLTFEDDVKAIARNLLGAFDFLLNLSSFRSSFFLDGTVLEAINHAAGPLSIGKIRHGIREGKLEFLGGSYHDSLLPLFPTELQQLQLKMHRKLLRKMFDVEPTGFFNSSMVWEMDMTDLLSRESFECLRRFFMGNVPEESIDWNLLMEECA